MKFKLMYPDILKPFKEEIKSFKLEKALDMQSPVLSTDIPVGELNDYERRCNEWMLFAQSILETYNTHEFIEQMQKDGNLGELFVKQQQMLLAKMGEAQSSLTISLLRRMKKVIEKNKSKKKKGIAVREGHIVVVIPNFKKDMARAKKMLKRSLMFSAIPLRHSDN